MTATIWRFTKGAEKELFLIRYLNSCVTSLASVGFGFHISEDTRKEKLLFASFRVLQDSHGLRTKQEKGMIFSVGPFITESLKSLLSLMTLVLKQFPEPQLPTINAQKTNKKYTAYRFPLNRQASANVTISDIG